MPNARFIYEFMPMHDNYQAHTAAVVRDDLLEVGISVME